MAARTQKTAQAQPRRWGTRHQFQRGGAPTATYPDTEAGSLKPTKFTQSAAGQGAKPLDLNKHCRGTGATRD